MTETPEGRIPRLRLEEAKAVAADAGVPEYMCDLSIFQVLLRHPDLAAKFNDLLGQMLWHSRFDKRLRELVIMRLGWRTGSVYEWTQHWNVGPMFDAAPDDLHATRDPAGHAAFGEAELAVLQAVDDVVDHGAVQPATWERCVAVLEGDEAALIEMVTAIATWHMVSIVLKSLEVPLEDGIDPWPPDGVGPA